MNNPSTETIFRQLERLTAEAAPVAANEHPTYQALMEIDPNNISPDLVVTRRKQMKHQLGSGAVHSLTLEHATDGGRQILSAYDNNPVVGHITTRIEAGSQSEPGSVQLNGQFTQLAIDFDQSGTSYLDIDARVPLDEVLEEETRKEWERWGLALHYENTNRGGRLAVQRLPSHLGSIATTLSALR